MSQSMVLSVQFVPCGAIGHGCVSVRGALALQLPALQV
jgi:hypothetical protein